MCKKYTIGLSLTNVSQCETQFSDISSQHKICSLEFIKDEVILLLLLARKFYKNSLFSDEYFPLDIFKIIINMVNMVKATKWNDNLEQQHKFPTNIVSKNAVWRLVNIIPSYPTDNYYYLQNGNKPTAIILNNKCGSSYYGKLMKLSQIQDKDKCDKYNKPFSTFVNMTMYPSKRIHSDILYIDDFINTNYKLSILDKPEKKIHYLYDKEYKKYKRHYKSNFYPNKYVKKVLIK